MKIGIISDTHGHLEPAAFKYFEPCDEIWHAGDIGPLALLEELEAFKPTHAVWGNIDGHEVRTATQEVLLMQRDGMKILMVHIAGKFAVYTPQVRSLILQHRPHLLVCGHSHLLKVQRDPKHNLLYINPGAAGIHGFHQMKTLLRFEIKDGKPQNMEVIELGKRGRNPS